MSVNYKNQLIDNTDNYKLLNYIKELLLDETYNELYIATGYWDIPAIAVLNEELSTFLKRENTKIKLLLGEDPEVQNYQLKHSADIDLNNYPKSYFEYHLNNIPVTSEYEDSIALLLEYASGDNPKFQIHVFDKHINKSFLHAKCYIFVGNDDSKAIVGSSNFTRNGLVNNSELNYLEINSANITSEPKTGNTQKGHIFWFNEQWEKSRSWDRIFIRILAKSNIGQRSYGKIKESPEKSEETKNRISQIFENIDKDEDMKVPRIPEWLHLFDYQKDAINNWKENNYCGIFDMATGTGKTLTGLSAMAVLSEAIEDKLAVFIVCPYQHLVEQWVEDIVKFGIEPIIGYSDSAQKNWRTRLKNAIVDQRFVKDKQFFCFISTNATFSSDFVQEQIQTIKSNALLLVDEAHNFGAEYLRQLLSDKFNYRLALSATLERHGDKEGTESLYDYFGPKCIEYDLGRAIRENKLTPYRYHPVLTYLTEPELDKYQELTKRIGKCIIKGKHGLKLNELGKRLALERSRLVAGASEKIVTLDKEIQPYINDKHILVYCGATRVFDEDSYGLTDDEQNDDIQEGKRQIEVITDLLGNKLGMAVSQFTSKEDMQERATLLKEFSKGEDLKVLIAIKCLDEGVNIPEIKTAFILASTTNPKEYIQRRGRVLRKADGKTYADIYDFITLPRPLNDVYGLTKEAKNQDKSLVIKELVRAYEFSRIADNQSEAEAILNKIKELYELEDKDLKETEEKTYE